MKQTEVCVVDTFTTCYAQIKVLARVTVNKIALPIRLLSGEKRDEKPRFSKGFCLFILMALMELERKFAAAFVLHSKEVKENCSTFPTLSCVPISHAVSRSGHVAFCALLFAFSLIAGEIALTHKLSRGTLHSSSPLAPPISCISADGKQRRCCKKSYCTSDLAVSDFFLTLSKC